MFLAYIDPGTGSIVLQALIGGIFAVWLFFRVQISSLFSKIFSRHKIDEPEDDF